MNVSVELTKDLMEYVEKKRRSGLYKSRSEVFRDALRKMINEELSSGVRSKLSPEDFKRLRKEVGEKIVKARFPEMS
ncbi:MAG: ribbon-helix-helix domain-containing protein [Candidatus Altiarchaeota archaeon]